MNVKKIVTNLIGALVIGGLGNGVWEYILEPALAWGLHGLLNIATLGVQSYKDDLYREIAKGFHEESSLTLANTLNYLIACAVVFGLLQQLQSSRKLIDEIKVTNSELDSLEQEVENPKGQEQHQTKEGLKERISQVRNKNSGLEPKAKFIHKATSLLFAFGVAFYAWTLIGAVKDRYINTAIVHYEQSLAIIAPVITADEMTLLKSRFARVTSRKDYEALMEDVATYGKRGNYSLTQFSIW